MMRVQAAIVWLFFLISFAWMLKAIFLGFYPDFSVYYYGSKYFLQHQNPYLSGQLLYSGYSYPPIVFLVFLPFVVLPFQLAENIWVLLNVFFLLASLFFLAKTFSVKFYSNLNLLLSGFAFISFPTKFTLGMGQVNIFVLFILVLSLYFMKKKKDFYSGLLLGVSIGIKIFPILIPLIILLKKKQKLFLGLLSSLGFFLMLMLLFVPSKTYLYFIQNVVPYFFSASWKLEYYSQSLSAFVGRTFGTQTLGSNIKGIGTVAIIFTILFMTFKIKEKTFKITSLFFGYILIASMLINTFSWQHHYVWLIIPFYTLFIYLLKNKGKKWEFLVVVLSYFLVSTNLKNPQNVPVLIQSHIFIGTLLLFILETKILLDSRK